MDDLAQFLRTRYEEAASPRAIAAWHEAFCLSASNDNGSCFYCGATEQPDQVEHVPQAPKVLADLESKIAIVDAYEQAAAWYSQPENRDVPAGEVNGLRTALCFLAQPFSEHPEYRETWRP